MKVLAFGNWPSSGRRSAVNQCYWFLFFIRLRCRNTLSYGHHSEWTDKDRLILDFISKFEHFPCENIRLIATGLVCSAYALKSYSYSNLKY